MGRTAKIPDAKQKEVAFDILSGKYSRRDAVKMLESDGYPPVSDIAIQRYMDKWRAEWEVESTPVVTEKKTVTVSTNILSHGTLAAFEADINRINDAISTHYDFINTMKRRIEELEREGSPSHMNRADNLRKRISESFIALVKAEVSKIELLRDEIIMKQSAEMKTNVATDIQDAYDRGYKVGLEDAEKKFTELMKEYRKKSISIETQP